MFSVSFYKLLGVFACIYGLLTHDRYFVLFGLYFFTKVELKQIKDLIEKKDA